MSKRYFEGAEHAKLYVSARPTVPENLLDIITDYLNNGSQGPMNFAVDIACGSGQSSLPLAKRFKKVLGIDISDSQIEEAKKRNVDGNLEFQVGKGEVIPVDDGSLDLVFCCTAVHWLDIPAFLKEAKRALRPGGVLAVTSFFHWEDPIELEKKDRDLFVTAWNEYEKMIRGHFDSAIDLYYDKYKGIHPLEGFNDCSYDPEIKFRRESSLRNQLDFFMSASAFQNMVKSDPEKAERVKARLDELFNQMEADLDQPRQFEGSLFLLLGRK